MDLSFRELEAVLLETMIEARRKAVIRSEKGSAWIRAESHRSIAPLILTTKSFAQLPRFRQMIDGPRRYGLGRTGFVEFV